MRLVSNLRIITWIDGLVLLLAISLIYAEPPMSISKGIHPVVMVEPFILAYFFLRLLLTLKGKYISCLFLLILVVLCARELWLGYVQLFQNFGKGRGQDVCVGSFSNSGPLGCFLAMSASLFVAVFNRLSKQIVKFPIAVLAVLSVILIFCTLSRASLLSFAVSMMLLALKSKKCSAFIRQKCVYISIALLLMGTLGYIVKKPSADGRILMAKVGLRMMKENGLRGVGIGNYEGAYGKAQACLFAEYMDGKTDFPDIDRIPQNIRMISGCPDYAFNEYIKMGVEAGPTVMLLLMGLIITGIVSSYKNGFCWCYPLVVVAVFSCFSYPYEVNLILLFLIVCLASADIPLQSCNKGWFYYAIIILVLSPFCAARMNLNRGKGVVADTGIITRLCSNRPKRYIIHGLSHVPDGIYDERLLFDYGKSLNEKGRYAESDSVLTIGTMVSSDPMFWNVMGNNSLERGDYAKAEECYKQAFLMVPNRLYPLYLLAKLYYTEGDTTRFIEMSNRISHFKVKVESAKTRRMKDEIVQLGTVF